MAGDGRAARDAWRERAASAPAKRDRRPRPDANPVAIPQRDIGVRGDRGRLVAQRGPVGGAEVADDEGAVVAALEHGVQAGDARVNGWCGEVDLGALLAGRAAAAAD